jgi:hypothetical protein
MPAQSLKLRDTRSHVSTAIRSSNDGLRSRNSSIISRETKQQHSFQITTFGKPTYCDLCSNFIWGVVKQGYSCVDCGYNVHKKCLPLVVTECNPVHYHAPRKSKDYIRKSLDAPRKQSSTKATNIVTKLLEETQVQSRKMEKAISDANPSLNMTTFMKQNNRFTARQGPLIWLNETILKLLTWQSVPNTLMFLLCYTLVCLHPILIPILPQIALLFFIVQFYHQRADLIKNGAPLPQPHVIGQPPKLSPSATELKAAFQNIQNTMIKVSDAYDSGYNLYRMIDWSDPQLTQDVLVKTVISLFLTLVVITFIPINYVALVGGISIFVANTAIFKAASVTLTPVLVQKLQKRVDQVRKLVREAKESGNEAVIDVAVYENQRWWAGV